MATPTIQRGALNLEDAGNDNQIQVATALNRQGRTRSIKSMTFSVHPDAEYTRDGSVDFHGKRSVKNKSGNWKACPFILGNECCERLAYNGINTIMVNYLTKHLGQGNATAANNVTNWAGTCYITALIGAFMADAYWGRYKTIVVFSILSIFGMTLLTISASIPTLKPPQCTDSDLNCHATTVQIGVVFLSLYIIALGTGGMRPCLSSFGADQFDETDDIEKKRKSSFFSWFYFSINIGALVASSVLVWIHEIVGWQWSFGIPAVAMGIAVCSFFSGTVLYRNQKPGGSPLTRIAQVLVSAFRKWRILVPRDTSLLYEVQDEESVIEGSRKLEHTDEFPFLDKAAIETENDKSTVGSNNPWRLCTVTQVEELKSVIRIVPFWVGGIIFNTAYSQMSKLFVKQGEAMDAHIGPHFQIPAASLSIFDTLSVLFWVLVYERLFVPLVRKYTGNPRGVTQLQRVGIGLVICIVSLVAAAIVEIKRLNMVKEYNSYESGTVPMSIFWQVPQYFLLAAAEVFTIVGMLEFFYDQAPDAMRSILSAVSLTTVALGSYLGTLLVTIVGSITTRHGNTGWITNNLNYGHIDYFFWLLAILSGLNFFIFIIVALGYAYKRPAGAFHALLQKTERP